MSKSASPISLNSPSDLKGWSAWIWATRPKTLFASLSPVLVGAAFLWRDGVPLTWVTLLALLGAALLQVESNLANDYFDWKKGADTKDRLGPLRVTSAGLIAPSAMRKAMTLVAALSVLVGLALVARGGLPILLIGLAGLISAFLYTAGPKPLAYLGLGDVFVFTFFGPAAVAGTYFVQSLQWSPASLYASVPVGLFSVAILLVNNIRDFEEDRKSSKKTLVVRLGVSRALSLYSLCVFSPVILIPFGVVLKLLPMGSLLSLLILPLSIQLSRKLRVTQGRALNPLLGETARLLLIFSVLLAVGVIL